MSSNPESSPNSVPDWARDRTSYLLRWGLPSVAIAVALFAPVNWRVPIWCVALVVMGVSCLINARRCGRVHCQYTGPWYLAMILPTLWLGARSSSADNLGWSILAGLILFGSKIIWWLTEHQAGRYRANPDQ